MKEMEKVFTLNCDCSKTLGLHSSKVWIDMEDEEVLIYTSMVHYLPWYKKVIPAIKYITGIDNTHVDYMETYLTLEDFKGKLNDMKGFIEGR